jgi:hypothetical protein
MLAKSGGIHATGCADRAFHLMVTGEPALFGNPVQRQVGFADEFHRVEGPVFADDFRHSPTKGSISGVSNSSI